MELTPTSIRSTLRARIEWPEGAAGDLLAGDLCRRLAQLPDVRRSKVEEVTAHLLAAGPPAALLLADMLVAELAQAGVVPPAPGDGGDPWLCFAGCARVCGCKSMPVAGETTHVRRPVVVEHGAA